MAWISVGRADIETTDLGQSAFNGESSTVLEKCMSGINWEFEGSSVIDGALYGKHLELACAVLRAGSPVEESTYFIAFDFCPQMLLHLPSNPELVRKIEASRRWPEFNWALVNQDVDRARELLSKGVSINERILISHGMGMLCPIHYSVRNANVQLIKLVLEGGANPNALTNDGKSPLRLVGENTLLTRTDRLLATRVLRAHGAEIIPMPSFWEEILFSWFGSALKNY